MNNQTTGLFMCSVTCLVPLLVGGILGWRLHERVLAYGLPGALVPGFIRRWLEEK